MSEINQTRFTWPHDCDDCRLLGRVDYVDPGSGHTKSADLYHCPKAESDMGGSLLARMSDEPSDYASTPSQILEARADAPSFPLSTSGPALLFALMLLRNQEAQQ
jgi:hypothetical protein